MNDNQAFGFLFHVGNTAGWAVELRSLRDYGAISLLPQDPTEQLANSRVEQRSTDRETDSWPAIPPGQLVDRHCEWGSNRWEGRCFEFFEWSAWWRRVCANREAIRRLSLILYSHSSLYNLTECIIKHLNLWMVSNKGGVNNEEAHFRRNVRYPKS